MLRPLKFRPILKETLWGGKRLAAKSPSPPKGSIGESWEISAVEGDISSVSEGPLKDNDLEELIEIYTGELVGDGIYEKYGKEFPLLLKYIDAHDKLSVQVHPTDEIAKERHNAYGKTEMWYIVDASPEAEIILGFKENCRKDIYTECLAKGNIEEHLNRIPVKKGDCFFIPAGTVHAIGKGCYIAEIQENSDITYRIYDYDRKDKDGNLRELHTEWAKDVIDFSAQKDKQIPYRKHIEGTEKILRCPYFSVNILSLSKKTEKDYFLLDSFVVHMCISGSYTLVYGEDEYTEVKEGDTLLIPACLKNISIIPRDKTEIIEIYVEN